MITNMVLKHCKQCVLVMLVVDKPLMKAIYNLLNSYKNTLMMAKLKAKLKKK